MKPQAVFVTGTDTEVGKTVVSGLLGRFLLEKKYKAITQKWVQTGTKGLSQDIDRHLALMGIKKKDMVDFLPAMAPYSFKFAASPHLAAACEKKAIRADKIKRSFKVLSGNFDFVIVEGTGGVLVPFDKKRLLIDIAAELRLPALIVARNKLGAINHTLLTIEALKRRGLTIIGIIFNNLSKTANKVILRDNLRIIEALGAERILGNLPCCHDRERLYKNFVPIGRKILSECKKEGLV
jgi:dethiobiotin synthetase